MKTVCKVLAVVLLLVSASAFAATNLDGTYSFKSRSTDASMNGWTGTMTVKGDTMSRNYKSPDGKTVKFYDSTLKQDGNVYVMKTTKAYKPEYVGNELRNKIIVKDNNLTIESADGKFKEEWTKK